MPSRQAPEIVVLLNGRAVDWLVPLSVERSSGGGRLDMAILRRDNRQAKERFVLDAALPASTNQEVEILGRSPLGETVYFWGKMSIDRIRIGEREDFHEMVARVEPYHFGQPVYRQWVYNPATRQHQQIDRPLVFNPLVDGKVRGNKRAGNQRNGAPVFLDPESVQTAAAESSQGSKALEWKLSEVLHYLLISANGDQQFIRNPGLAEIRSTVDDRIDFVRNLRIKEGEYLPQVLDRVLKPFGYDWYLDLASPGRRVLRFFKRGVGVNDRLLRLARPGDDLLTDPSDERATNVATLAVDYDISAAFNEVVGRGDFAEIEATFELSRAWSTADDAKRNQPHKLKNEKGNADWQTYKNVWRKWVLNEAGDYNGLRRGLEQPYDFNAVIAREHAIPRRRKFLPCLTLAKDGTRPIGQIGGCRVQYWRAQGSSQGAWVDVGNMACHILEDECGVYFSGLQPPHEIVSQGDNAKVRITATIRFDLRMNYRAAMQRSSPNGDRSQLVLDLAKRFHYRQVHATSIHAAEVRAGTLKSLQEDDRQALQKYIEQIRQAWDIASVSGPITLEGIDRWTFKLGDSVIGIEGRNISLSGRPSGGPIEWPQIVGIAFDLQGQKTMLTLDHYAFTKRFLQDAEGIE